MYALRLRLGALSIVIGLAASLSAGSAWAEPAQPERREARFQGWTPLSDYVVAGLGEGGTFRLTVPTRAGNVELALHPSAVHADDYHGEEAHPVGARRGRGLPRVRTFAGSVEEDGASFTPLPVRGGDFARLALEENARLSGLLRVDGVYYDLAADAARGDLLLHVREVTPEELEGAGVSCGASVDEALVAAAEVGEAEGDVPPASEAAGALREIELGTEADAPFVAQSGGVDAANAKILSIVNSINGIYEFDLGLTNRVVFQRAWNGSDPYSVTENDTYSDTVLNEFRSNFLANVGTPTDDAHLFSGRDFEGSTVGRAFVATTCKPYRFGLSQFYNGSVELMRLIVAHEIGHNLGGGHTSTGLMAPSINASVTWFSAESQNQIAGYVDGVSCLAEVETGGVPVLAPVGPQEVTESDLLELQLEANDPDGDALTFSATPLPTGASLSANGLFRWTPPRTSAGCGGFVDRTVTFTVRDPDGNRATEAVVISVLDAPSDAPPVLDDPADRSATPGQALTIPLSASDADGDSVSFSAASLPSGASLSASGLFRWTPSTGQLGRHELTFTATDCTGRSGSEDLAIDVVIDAPVLGAISAASGWKGDFVTISGENLAGRKVKVFFGPKKTKARNVTATSLDVKIPKKKKSVIGNEVAVTVVRDGIVSANALSFTYVAPTP